MTNLDNYDLKVRRALEEYFYALPGTMNDGYYRLPGYHFKTNRHLDCIQAIEKAPFIALRSLREDRGADGLYTVEVSIERNLFEQSEMGIPITENLFIEYLEKTYGVGVLFSTAMQVYHLTLNTLEQVGDLSRRLIHVFNVTHAGYIRVNYLPSTDNWYIEIPAHPEKEPEDVY